MTKPQNRNTDMWELDMNDPYIYPWNPPPIENEDLIINKLQYICKVAIKKHNNCFTAMNTQKLDCR